MCRPRLEREVPDVGPAVGDGHASGQPCEFEVCIEPVYSCTIKETVILSGVVLIRLPEFMVWVGFEARTRRTTEMHSDDIVCERWIGGNL